MSEDCAGPRPIQLQVATFCAALAFLCTRPCFPTNSSSGSGSLDGQSASQTETLPLFFSQVPRCYASCDASAVCGVDGLSCEMKVESKLKNNRAF